jgi:hypothetical protein
VQNKDTQEKSKTSITLGLNIIETNDYIAGSGIVLLIEEKLNFKTQFFITAERRFDSDFSTFSSFSTKQL